MKTIALSALVLASILLGGCKSASIVGKYSSSDTKVPVTIEFKEDKTFSMSSPSSQGKSLEGHYTESGDDIKITAESIGGKSIDAFVKESSDKKSITLTQNGQTVKLVRSES